jgi:hypothetical protein
MTRPEIYFPGPPADPAAQDAKHAVVDDVRAIVEDLIAVDAGAAGPDALAEVASLVAKARAAIAGLPRLPDDETNRRPESSLAERSPLAGRSNALAAPLHLDMDGDRTSGWAVYGPAYAGKVGDMHGGVVMAAFDDLLGCAQMAGPVSGRTGTLTVRFRAPSPIGQRIDYEAWIERTEGRKAFCAGVARHGDVVLAQAEGIFVAPRQ